MLYDAYEVQRSLLTSASKLAGLGAGWLNNPTNPFGYSAMGPRVAAGLEVFAPPCAPRGQRGEAFTDGGRVGGRAAVDRGTDVAPLCDAAARHSGADAAQA